ncbi:response regulator [Aureitalea sp. L0-47]|uniref:LytR/AlgR family response regulator transcription factor n=1 Tax=Aureitalea sp. L0-47 TaxID=2816962 RepID=UPI0022391072|nr:response regulator [Aureitalea sp. L0-47]MCW5518916.1 response regulator [Aureitalea sp. L0-47]
MPALKIFIVEDEPLIAVTIETALLKQGFSVLGDAENYEEAIAAVQKEKPDLVLLDIQLEGEKDGVELAMEFDKRKIPYLYLTSQTDPETVNRVKETHPLGFIVKPFTEAGLRSHIELAWHKLSSTKNEFLVIKSEGETYKLNQQDILYLKAFDNYCYVVTKDHSYLVPKTLKFTSEGLNPAHFAKPHRSFVVNLRKVSKMTLDSLEIEGDLIPLSASNKESIKEKLRTA